MTTTRYEIIIQGSNDNATWQNYEFKYKPQALDKIPPQIAPFQPRLDWQMWFVALGPAERSPWFSNFIAKLLENSPDVTALLKTNPFPDNPPKLIRAIIYEYKFSDFKTRKSLDQWWVRDYKGIYFPAVSLNQGN